MAQKVVLQKLHRKINNNGIKRIKKNIFFKCVARPVFFFGYNSNIKLTPKNAILYPFRPPIPLLIIVSNV